MNIIDQLDDRINELEYDVIIPSKANSIEEILESTASSPDVKSGMVNSTALIVVNDEEEYGNSDFDYLLESLDILSEELVINLGLVNNTIAQGFSTMQTSNRRMIQHLASIDQVLTDQWEREKKDRALGVKRTIDKDPQLGIFGSLFGSNQSGSGSDTNLSLGGGIPEFGGKDKDKKDSKSKPTKSNKPQTKRSLLKSALTSKPGRVVATVATLFGLSEAMGMTDVTGIFGDDSVVEPEAVDSKTVNPDEVQTQQPQSVASQLISNDPDVISGDATPIGIDPVNVTSASPLDINSTNIIGAGLGATGLGLAYQNRESLTNTIQNSRLTEKVGKLRERFADSTSDSKTKIGSRFSQIKTAMAGNPTRVDMFSQSSEFLNDLRPNSNVPTNNPITAKSTGGSNSYMKKLGSVGKSAGKFGAKAFGPLATLGLSGLDVYNIHNDENMTDEQKRKAYGNLAGNTSAALAGAATGAAIGSVIPGVGTIIGGLLGLGGGLLGSVLDSAAAGEGEESFLGSIINNITEDSPEETKESNDKSFFSNMSILSALGPVGMLADYLGADEAIADYFGSDTKDMKDVPKVESKVPETTVKVENTQDTPYIKELQKAIPHYIENHNVSGVSSKEIVDIYRMKNTSQSMANAMAKDYLGENFTAEKAIYEYQNRSNLATASQLETNSVTTATANSLVTNTSDYGNEVNTNSVSENTKVERVSDEVVRHNYTESAPNPEVQVNLDKAAETKQEAPPRLMSKNNNPANNNNQPRVIKQPVATPPSLGNIDNLDSAAGISHLNKSIG